MPFSFDFKTLDNVKEARVNPDGWIDSLTIEYGINYHGESISYFWRVKGTTHTFVIPVMRLDYISNGEYVSHFKETLENFRDEYVQWAKQDFSVPWMKEYRNEYKRYICV